ncbi:MAG: class I SAM-dependent RNA methyltransferase [Alphaproteobacteria bacterium]|nr:class I SAM-dependent RNA methyltransferase [Alphaproteobacteria bacterium]
MQTVECSKCGGCALRNMQMSEYRRVKEDDFIKTIKHIKKATPQFDMPIFIEDGQRRRANMTFLTSEKKLYLGFNARESHQIVDIASCPMLCSQLNQLLEPLHRFLQEFCQIKISLKNKKKKIQVTNIDKGDIYILAADNGVDIMLEIFQQPTIEHRMLVADFVQQVPNICRFSWKINQSLPETVVENITPEIVVAGYHLAIPQGVFLQASKKAETAMINKVLEYLGETRGYLADLFCGLGTFTLPIAKMKENNVLAVDSSTDALRGLQKALNINQCQNVQVLNRNLFKEPLDATELGKIKTLIMDPPRAGAHQQCREIAKLPISMKPSKIIFISCNPKTFVYDAELLINAGYNLEKITLIDQFVYSPHQELIALLTLTPNAN